MPGSGSQNTVIECAVDASTEELEQKDFLFDKR